MASPMDSPDSTADMAKKKSNSISESYLMEEKSMRPTTANTENGEARHSTASQVVELEGSNPGDATPPESTMLYLKGWKLWMVFISLSLALFLASLEVSIVSTSLVAITDDLRGFSQSSWIITAYMLTYTGFLIIWAKLSDIFGRKLFVVTSVVVFTAFSGACGAAQTTTQLIIFRALQGVGGAGTYSLAVVIFLELVSPEKFAATTSAVTGVLALALLLGPLLGGVINNSTTWRWIFLLNVPLGIIVMVALLIAIPNNFPHHGKPRSVYVPPTVKQVFSKDSFNRVDFLGVGLLLSASILLVAALEEAGVQFEWNSPFVISTMTISGLLWIAFLAWEWKTTRDEGLRQPIFPWRFLQTRVRVGMIVSMMLVGAPFTIAVIQIPLRFQIVNSLSALQAGLRLLPFAVSSPIGSGISAGLATKRKIPPIYLILGGSVIQIIGFALISTAPTDTTISNAQYGFEVLCGIGVGINLAQLIVMAPFTVEQRDHSVAMSAMVQFRTMGGAIGLAIVTSAMNSYVRSNLLQVLPADQVTELLQTTQAFAALSPDMALTVRRVFAEAFNLQMKIAIGLAGAQIPLALLMWKKKQITV